METPYYFLIEAETTEAKHKHSRLLNYNDLREVELSVEKIEGSTVTSSSNLSSDFSSFNIAKIQETSTDGIAEICTSLSMKSQIHTLATVPHGITESGYEALAEFGYKTFQHKSLLHLEMQKSKIPPAPTELKIEFGNSEKELNFASMVLRDFYPKRTIFDQHYSYWIHENPRVEIFLGFIANEPVAMGILSWTDHAESKVGLLSSGVVASAHRGKGLQQILIGARIQRARKLGLQHLFAPGVPPFSASEASLRKSGFVLLCNRTFWRK